MRPDVAKEIQALAEMTVSDLLEKYREVFGEEPHTRHKVSLQRRIAWRIQANAEGGLSKRARKRAQVLARDADLRSG